MKRYLLLTSCLLAASGAWAQATINQSPAYQECTTLASTNPAQALAKADAWLKIDTGIAAQHCRAMALYGLQRFAEAGDALTAVRESISADNIPLRAYIARQISRAWMSGNQADKALVVLNNQITEISATRADNAAMAKLTADLLLDRARLQASYGKLDDAAKDLDHAVSLTPINEEVLMERASVFEKLGDRPLARNDAEIVLKLNGKNAKAREMLMRLGVMQPPAANLAAPASPAPLMASPTQPAINYEEAPVSAPAPVSKPVKRKKPVRKATAKTVTPDNQAP